MSGHKPDLQQRLDADLARGDLGSARRRLQGRMAGVFDPSIAEQLAGICADMKDPIEAGRWFFLIESSDDRSAACIEAFVDSVQRVRAQVEASLPRVNVKGDGIERLSGGATWPRITAERLNALGPRSSAPLPNLRRPPGAWSGWVIMCVLTLVATCAVIGAWRIAQWIKTLIIGQLP